MIMNAHVVENSFDHQKFSPKCDILADKTKFIYKAMRTETGVTQLQ